MDEYALFEDVGGIVRVISLVLIFVGEFLRRDGYSKSRPGGVDS
jgi:hypothetical protein